MIHDFLNYYPDFSKQKGNKLFFFLFWPETNSLLTLKFGNLLPHGTVLGENNHYVLNLKKREWISEIGYSN